MSPRNPRPALLGTVVGSLVAGGLAAGSIAAAAPALAASPDVLINEVYGGGGNSGAPVSNDFVELVNRSGAPVVLDGWSVQYASATGTSWQVTPLSGSIPAGGTYLVQEAAGATPGAPLVAPDATGGIAMGGSSGKVALSTGATALTCGTGCAGAVGVHDLVGYGSAVGGEGAPTAALSSTTSASRTAGPDTDDNRADFTVGAPSPTGSGSTPPVEPPPAEAPACDTGTVTIGSVQGSGPVETVPAGQSVTVAGTVVADLQSGLDGFYLQDTGDGDAATSDGVFVYAPGGTAVELGDRVTVRGTPAEFAGLTELTEVAYTGCGAGVLPRPAELPLPSTDAQREALEGMFVAPPSGLTVTEVYDLNRYGAIQLAAGGRLISPTEGAETGDPARALAAANAARSLTLDDGSDTNLSTAGLAPPYLTATDPVRVGDTAVLDPTVLTWSFDAWTLEPADGTAEGTSFTATNPRPAAPPAVGGDLRVADFNVLNYFVTFGGQARGADDAAELAEQQAKIVSALTALDADVYTLHEIENSAVTTPATPYAAVETLVAALSAATGHSYGYVPAHEDTDVITNAIVFRTDRVTPVGEPMVPADLSAFDNARTPIAQTFTADGETFSLIANHLKSKGSSCGAASDATDEGGGNCNGDRVVQAQVLTAFAAQVAQASGDPDVLLTGDFNSYRYEDPIDVVRAAGFTDMGPALAPEQYSYVFRGGSGSLDHVFASPSMVAELTGLGVWDINATESFAYEYDGYEPFYAADPYRASDHNPTVFGIRTQTVTEVPATAELSTATPARRSVLTVTGRGFAAGETVTVTLPGEPTPHQLVGSGTASAEGTVVVAFTVPAANRKGPQTVLLTGAGGETAGATYTVR